MRLALKRDQIVREKEKSRTVGSVGILGDRGGDGGGAGVLGGG